MAVEAALKYRAGTQRTKLKPSELITSNFLLNIKSGDRAVFLSDAERHGHCYEIYFVPQVAAGESVFLHKTEMKLGRYALYIVCGVTNTVARSQLGSEVLQSGQDSLPAK